MLIRPANIDDVPNIMQIVHRVVPLMRASGNLQWDEHYPNPEAFANDISLAQLWAAQFDEQIDGQLAGQVAGVAALTMDQSQEYVDVGWDIAEPAIVIHRLVVDPAFQGRGVAIALLEHAEIIARQRGIPRVRVDTNTQNQVTQRLLPKLGYTLAGEIGLAFRPGLRFVCYEKLLPSSD